MREIECEKLRIKQIRRTDKLLKVNCKHTKFWGMVVVRRGLCKETALEWNQSSSQRHFSETCKKNIKIKLANIQKRSNHFLLKRSILNTDSATQYNQPLSIKWAFPSVELFTIKWSKQIHCCNTILSNNTVKKNNA